jgi:DNA polymerase I-like protein with 3'-5' exonuclease and polymerase domains
MVERFIAKPYTDLHGECATLMSIPRRPAKIINLALAYGAQGANICHQLGLPTQWITSRRSGLQIEIAGPEGEELLRKHFEAVPFIKGIFDIAKNRATSRGFVTTISGRRIRFEKYADGNYVRPYKALNGVIQGSAADQMKMALVAFRREKLRINLTVHDEADLSLPFGEEGERLNARMTEIMEEVCPISVPMIAETTLGANWGQC